MKRYKTILVDDHLLFRKGLRLILEEMDEIEIIAEASNGKEFNRIIDNIMPDLVLMDIKMPGLEGDIITRKTLEKKPDILIIALTMFSEIEYFHRMQDAGVSGYILKNADPAELTSAIRKVLSGKTYYSQELLLNLIKFDTQIPDNNKIDLSDREIEVLKLICQGYSNGEIAEKLYLSIRTIETHRANLLSKTNSKNTVQLVVHAIREKLFHV